MRPHTAIHVSSYYYISVLRAHEAQQDPALYMYAKLPTIYVSACYYICVLDMCPHTAIYVSSGACRAHRFRAHTTIHTTMYAHATTCATQSTIYVSSGACRAPRIDARTPIHTTIYTTIYAHTTVYTTIYTTMYTTIYTTICTTRTNHKCVVRSMTHASTWRSFYYIYSYTYYYICSYCYTYYSYMCRQEHDARLDPAPDWLVEFALEQSHPLVQVAFPEHRGLVRRLEV
jgi:hypothetical protein